MKLSIIIPVYNAQAYIIRCLESVYCQNLEEFEIILINDGSIDGSKKLIQKFCLEHSECIYLENSKNLGVSAARNKGLDVAQGDYIMFLDADDIWESDKITKVLDEMKECELLIGGFFITQGNQILDYKAEQSKRVKKEIFYYRLLLPSSQYLYGVLWNKVFKGDIIRKFSLRFREDIRICEDWPFLLSYLEHINKIRIVNMIFYRYTQDNPLSLVKKRRERGENWYSLYRVYMTILQKYKDYLMLKEYRVLISNFMLNPVITESLEIIQCETENMQKLRKFLKHKDVRGIIDNAQSKVLFEFIFIHLCRKKHFWILKLLLQTNFLVGKCYRYNYKYYKVIEMK